MDKHVDHRIKNDQLRYALLTKEAKLERKQIGNMKGKRKVITINGKYHLYNPSKISKVVLNKLDKLSKTNKFREAQELKNIYLKHRRNNALKSYAIKYRAEISDTDSLFDS